MTDPLDTLEAVASKQLNVAQAAAVMGIAEADVTRKLEVLELAGALSRRQLRQVKRRVGAAVAALGALAAVTSSAWLAYPAWAATCAQTLPTPMVTFCPNNPALAAEMNTNLQQLVTWIQAKTGTISSANLTTNAVTASGALVAASVTSNGKVRGKAAVGTQGFEFDWNQSGSSGETDFVNFRDLGPGGFNFYNNGALLTSIDSNGKLTTGSLAVNLVNGRQPVYMSINNCPGAGSCMASCGTGVVKLGWGFHGVNGNTTNFDPQAGVCGKALSWMGSCVGQTSCTIYTACSSSSIALECW